MRRLDALGIPWDVTPGVPAFAAAAASLRRELTIPEVAQTVILTRYGRRASAMPGGGGARRPRRPRRDARHPPRRAGDRGDRRHARAALRRGLPGRRRRPRELARRGGAAGPAGDIAARRPARPACGAPPMIVVGPALAAEGFRDSHLYSDATRPPQQVGVHDPALALARLGAHPLDLVGPTSASGPATSSSSGVPRYAPQ